MHFISTSLLFIASAGLVSSATVDYKSINSSRGDAFPDFSYAGYHSSQKAIPSNSVTKSLEATSGNQTGRIQDALDEISASGGGVLLLKAGTYTLDAGLTIPNATVLRGAGIGQTYLKLSSGSFSAITLGYASDTPNTTVVSDITDDYVPTGAQKLNVKDASKLKAGQHIMVQRNLTAKWIRANGMADLVASGKTQTWISAGTEATQPRKVEYVSGNSIKLDVPLTDAIDSDYTPGTVATFTFPDAPSEMGVEDLSMTLSPTCSGKDITNSSCGGSAISIPAWVTDSWARNLNLTGFNSFVLTREGAMRITVDNLTMHRDYKTDGSSGYPADITIRGTQILVSNCSSLGVASSKTWPVVTQKLTAGPNAVVNFYSQRTENIIAPHQRWAHGLLIENVTGASVEVMNLGTSGTGHGWTAAFSVGWNIDAYGLEIQSPPLATNWCVGCNGSSVSGNGTYIDKKIAVEPASLFKAQLADRGY